MAKFRESIVVDGWCDTNIRERHLRRNGKIVGKLIRFWEDGYPDKQLGRWYCYRYVKGKLTFIRTRVREGDAKRLVEWPVDPTSVEGKS